MADEHAALQQAVFQPYRAPLAEHLQDGRFGGRGVVLCPGVFFRQGGGEVFQVGQVHVHLALQGFENVRPLVAAAVPYHGQIAWDRPPQHPGERVGELGGGDQLDTAGPLARQPPKDGV